MTTTEHGKTIERPALSITPFLLLAALAALIPGTTQAQAYLVIDLPSLGGNVSEGRVVDQLGIVSGYSDLPGGAERHAVLWIDQQAHDLETLGGPNSAVVFGDGNHRGMIVGISETGALDPLDEQWSCSFFLKGDTPHVCQGFFWHDGEMTELPTLGGNHSFATDVNDRGLVTGWAENEVVDPTCTPPPDGTQVLQFRGVVWNPGTGELRELLPVAGDSVTTANALNNGGQIVGISGDCGVAVGGVSARHAVLWNNDGTTTDLGNLGGDVFNTPLAINEDGEVVGFAGLPSGFLGAFYWAEGDDMVSLGTLQEDHVHSEAWGVNNDGQAVGLSCDAAFADCRAFLWQDGTMVDLNDPEVTPGYSKHLRTARGINDAGMITGQAIDPATGARSAYLAIPIDAEE
jgi:probable HAF family extracellular repeat protein